MTKNVMTTILFKFYFVLCSYFTFKHKYEGGLFWTLVFSSVLQDLWEGNHS